jgi:nicotinate-nucleotide adenylyltransferase
VRIGILGGTFDPPHLGHLLIAEEAREKLDLARVYFVPARQPPHKLEEPVSPFQDRVAMLQLALDANPFFTVSLVEAERPGPSYTVDTLRELRREFPPDTELYFIMGLDSLTELSTWREPRAIIELAQLAVLRRPGYIVNLDRLEEQIPGLRSRIVFILGTDLDISSTELQARVRAGKSIHYMVPDAVADYISAQHLYRDA